MSDLLPSKYITLYKRAGKKEPQFGNLEDVQVGDMIVYSDENRMVNARVEKVNVKAGMLRTEAAVYSKWTLKVARSLAFKDIVELRRLNPEYPGYLEKSLDV